MSEIIPETTPLAARPLERALIFNFVIHGVAMISMALFLLPALPGGGVVSDVERVSYIAHHPWLFRLGWLPWQITAWADLWLGIALVRTKWIPRIASVWTVMMTALAILPDQLGQMLWITRGVHLATIASSDPSQLAHYLKFEHTIFLAVAGWGAIGYLLGAFGWTWCFVAGKTWSRLLTIISIAVWGVFAIGAALFFIPDAHKPNPLFIAVANALAFVLLEFWLLLVLEQVARRARPFTVFGRLARWKLSSESIVSKLAECIANSRALRLFGELIPMPKMASDVVDLVYINYLVDAARLQPLVPPGVELQRLKSGQAIFTVLTYRHGHFGPARFPCLRKCLGSPIQSNWRIYVTDPRTGESGIHFVTTTISNKISAVAARLLTEGVPMHVPGESTLNVDATSNDMTLRLRSAGGSAPDFAATLTPNPGRALPDDWSNSFSDYDAMLAYVMPQDRAFDGQPWRRSGTVQTFILKFPDSPATPLAGNVASKTLDAIFGDLSPPLSFLVPSVQFELIGQNRFAI